MSMLKCYWIVTAGLIPGQRDDKFTRRFEINSTQWDECRDSGERLLLLLTRGHEAVAYATQLQINSANGLSPNWVHTEYYWI